MVLASSSHSLSLYIPTYQYIIVLLSEHVCASVCGGNGRVCSEKSRTSVVADPPADSPPPLFQQHTSHIVSARNVLLSYHDRGINVAYTLYVTRTVHSCYRRLRIRVWLCIECGRKNLFIHSRCSVFSVSNAPACALYRARLSEPTTLAVQEKCTT